MIHTLPPRLVRALDELQADVTGDCHKDRRSTASGVVASRRVVPAYRWGNGCEIFETWHAAVARVEEI